MDGDSAHAVLPMIVVGDVGCAPRAGPPDRPLSSSTGMAENWITGRKEVELGVE